MLSRSMFGSKVDVEIWKDNRPKMKETTTCCFLFELCFKLNVPS